MDNSWWHSLSLTLFDFLLSNRNSIHFDVKLFCSIDLLARVPTECVSAFPIAMHVPLHVLFYIDWWWWRWRKRWWCWNVFFPILDTRFFSQFFMATRGSIWFIYTLRIWAVTLFWNKQFEKTRTSQRATKIPRKNTHTRAHTYKMKWDRMVYKKR